MKKRWGKWLLWCLSWMLIRCIFIVLRYIDMPQCNAYVSNEEKALFLLPINGSIVKKISQTYFDFFRHFWGTKSCFLLCHKLIIEGTDIFLHYWFDPIPWEIRTISHIKTVFELYSSLWLYRSNKWYLVQFVTFHVIFANAYGP